MKGVNVNSNRKLISYLFIKLFLFQLVVPTTSIRGNSGGAAMGSFTPMELTDLVDKFSGDFSYNIPLFEIGGYPFNLSYNSNIKPESQSSWVGLGWSLNPGEVSREVRGVPDDFKDGADGDEISFVDRLKTQKRNYIGVSAFISELAGISIPNNINVSVSPFWDSYEGFGIELGTDANLVSENKLQDIHKNLKGVRGGFSFSSSGGYSGSISASFGGDIFGGRVGVSGGTSSGLSSFEVGANASFEKLSQRRITRGLQRYLSNGVGTSFPIGSRSYIPSSGLPVASRGFNGEFEIGGEIVLGGPAMSISGGQSKQSLGGLFGFENPVLRRTQNAVGFLYYDEEHDYNKLNVIMDVLKEGESSLRKEVNSLEPAFQGYDLFRVQAQGLYETYKCTNGSNVRMFSDGNKDLNEFSSSVESINIGVEVNGGNVLKVGAQAGLNFSQGYSKGWHKGDIPFKLKPNNQNKGVYMTPVGGGFLGDEAFFSTSGGEKAIRPDLRKSSLYGKPTSQLTSMRSSVRLLNKFVSKNNAPIVLSANFDESNNTKPVVLFTASEAEQIERGSGQMVIHNFDNQIDEDFQRVGGWKKNHHVSRMDVFREDGMKFIFGLPVYTKVKAEVNFNVSYGNSRNDLKFGKNGQGASLVEYRHIGNDQDPTQLAGLSNNYSRKELDPYVNSLKLTEIRSSDYYDVGGDGLSADDIGTFVGFKYGRTSSFKSKVPSAYFLKTGEQHKYAFFSEGINSKIGGSIGDDQGSYVFEENEQWYLHKIYSKNEIAVFRISQSESEFDRSLNGEHGAFLNRHKMKLDRIDIYNKDEYDKTPDDVVPKKSIHFRYDYSLAKIGSNSNSGKLTLKKVFWTFQESEKSALNSYFFNYNNNPDFDSWKKDSWGDYCSSTEKPDLTKSLEERNNNGYDFPEKQPSNPNSDAGAWCISTIYQPTGSYINIIYEKDDYSYVQAKDAALGFPISGFFHTNNPDLGELTNELIRWSGLPGTNEEILPMENNFVFIEVTSQMLDGNSLENFQNFVNPSSKTIPIRALMDITGDGDFEWIKGIYPITSSGTHETGGKQFVWFKLKAGVIDGIPSVFNAKINPISLRSIELGQNEFSRKFMTGSNNLPTAPQGLEDALMLLSGMKNDLLSLLTGREYAMLKKGWGSDIDLSKSEIILSDFVKRKIGGGSRVSELEYNDNWSEDTDNNRYSTSKKFKYTYTIREKVGKVVKEISSGVAEWEPDGLSFHNPNLMEYRSNFKTGLFSSTNSYQFGPKGKFVFPNPNVGYRKVTVEEVDISNEPISKTEYGFYSAKEFPIRTDITDKQFNSAPNVLGEFLSMLSFTKSSSAYASQGFSIVINDMHGKPFFERKYEPNQGNPYYSVNYLYKIVGGDSNGGDLGGSMILESKADVLRKNGRVIQDVPVGRSVEMALFTKEVSSRSVQVSAQANVDVSMVGILPAFTVTGFAYPRYDLTFGRLVTATKIINQNGILHKREVLENGVKIYSEDLCFDEKTGKPVLSKSTDEMEREMYSVSIPAHYAYSELQGFGDYRDNYIMLDAISGHVQGANLSMLKTGDEILNDSYHFQIVRKGAIVYLVEKGGASDGIKSTTSFMNEEFKLFPYSQKNRLNEQVFTSTLIENPVSNGRMDFSGLKMLTCNISTFGNFNTPSNYCSCTELFDINNSEDLRLDLIFSNRFYRLENRGFVGPRLYPFALDNSLNYKEAGAFIVDLFPVKFRWGGLRINYSSTSDPDFFKGDLVLDYSMDGKPIEFVGEKDGEIERSLVSTGFGVNQSKPNFVVRNARVNEVFLEDFESAHSRTCGDNKFYFPSSKIGNTVHTGKRSFKLEAGGDFRIDGEIED